MEDRSEAPAGARSRAWSRFLEGRSPHPVEEPAVVMTGIRPFEPEFESYRNPRCRVCNGSVIAESHFCAGCDRLCPGDEAVIGHARKTTPAPRREPRAAPPAGTKAAEPATRRRSRAEARVRAAGAVVVEAGGLKGGIG
jgi:hypothetical protein